MQDLILKSKKLILISLNSNFDLRKKSVFNIQEQSNTNSVKKVFIPYLLYFPKENQQSELIFLIQFVCQTVYFFFSS